MYSIIQNHSDLGGNLNYMDIENRGRKIKGGKEHKRKFKDTS